MEINMYSLKILILAFFLISLATASTFANRQTALSSPEVDSPQAEQFERLREAIGLTSQQAMDIRAIITENKQDMVALRKESRANRGELRQILEAEVLDESRLRQLVEKQSELKIRKMVAQHDMRTRINRVLTEEQRQKRNIFRQQHGERRESFNRPEPLIDNNGR
jgi:Spy/CpxP family protein refolding chaperone